MLAIGLSSKSYNWDNLSKVKESLKNQTKFVASPVKKKNAIKTVLEEESSTVADALFNSSKSSNEDST